jgi:hypothetical protein
LSGPQDTAGSTTYTGPVTATISATDDVGVTSLTYSVDGAAAQAYSSPVTISGNGPHTVTATASDAATNTGTASSSFTISTGTQTGAPQLVVSSADSTLLSLSTPRLVFSTAPPLPAPAARSFTFTNNGTATLTVSNLAIAGTDASSFQLASGQATSFTVGPGASVPVSVVFRPTATTTCPTSSNGNLVGNAQRDATITYTTNDPVTPTGSNAVSGLNACNTGGNNEPVLDQLMHAFGYSTVVDAAGGDPHNLGPLRYYPGTDEIQSPYFTVANPAVPVTYAPIAQYSSTETGGPYHPGGWFVKGTTTASNQIFAFPPDPSATTYAEQQKVMPVPVGTTTFSPPTGPVFWVWLGDKGDPLWSDDSLDIARNPSHAALSPLVLLRGLRIFRAYGPGRVLIPNTYIVTTDVTSEPYDKNNDFQDIVAILKNVTPANAVAPAPGAASLDRNLASGVTVGASCAVTGFDGVLANTAGTQCNQANITATSSGLSLQSTAGQLATGDQQDALYNLFDATRGAFTVRARVVGGLNQVTSNYQQIATFFGPDTKNFFKVEFDNESSSSGTEPHMTMLYDEKGTTTTVTSSVPALSSASTLDLIIKGNTQVPDPAPSNDPNLLRGYPLDQITAYYSINGATPVQIGTTAMSPADVSSWFSTVAKAGILVSNSGSTTPLTATFNQFQISSP